MAVVNFTNVYKRYPGDIEAVSNFNLKIKDKEFIILVGPSGCGKSTILRMIAGLEEISKGELSVDGIRLNDSAPKDRNVAMVFQDYALYPHMNVYENMAFCLRLKKIPKEEIRRRVNESAEILGIEKLLQRKPKALSGGQKQRVALGRAIVREPKIFLMDEPLSNLDAKLRAQTRAEIVKLHRRLQTTFIYVTHDQTEAMTMGDRIVVMKEGVIQQIGTPKEVYEQPKNMFVAGFIGNPQMNLIPVKVKSRHATVCEFNIGSLKVGLRKQQSEMLMEKGYVDRELVFGIRAEDFLENANRQDNIWELKVDRTEILGAETLVYFNLESHELMVKFYGGRIPDAGHLIRLSFDPLKMYFFDKETGNRIQP